jgi:hypothetical protein
MGAAGLEAYIASQLAPYGRLPPVNLELFGIQPRRGHRRIRGDRIVGGIVVGSQLELSLAAIGPFCESVNREAEVREDFVVDDVVEEYRIRVEGVLRQDDTIVKSAVLTDVCILDFPETLL